MLYNICIFISIFPKYWQDKMTKVSVVSIGGIWFLRLKNTMGYAIFATNCQLVLWCA